MPHFQLKPLSPSNIESALKRAMRYRLLGEPWEAESICRDVLAIDEQNQSALITLLLALTDQITGELGEDVGELRELLHRLGRGYDRAYYTGIICERRGKALLGMAAAGAGSVVYDWLVEAMEWYEKAEALAEPGNEDALLRYNTCARLMTKHAQYVLPSPGPPSGEWKAKRAFADD